MSTRWKRKPIAYKSNTRRRGLFPFRNRKALVWIGILLCPLVVVISLAIVRPVFRAYETPGAFVSATTDTTVENEPLRLMRLEQETRFWQTRLALAEEDSAYMMADLQDSVVNLEYSGVTALRSPIHSYVLSTTLQRFQTDSGGHILNDDRMHINRMWATVPKLPIRRITPQSTEAPKAAPVEPDTLSAKPDVAVILEFDSGLVLYLKQAEPMSISGRLRFAGLQLKRRWAAVGREAQAIMGGEPPQPDHWLELTCPADDIVTMYRALSDDSMLLLRI